MAIQVKSEIGKLKKVMLHRPGKELEHLVPDDLERLLFDDIPYLRVAQKEHDRFADIMREQWNDGSNTLCIEPGKVVVYDRNYVTNHILRENGIEVLEMASSELSRGRGGPRCMSMPIVRDIL